MGRGIVSGGLFGLVFAALVLVLVGQLTERRSLPAAVPGVAPVAALPAAPPVTAPNAPAAPVPGDADGAGDAGAPVPDSAAPVVPAPAPLAPGTTEVRPTPASVPVVGAEPVAPVVPAPDRPGAGAPGAAAVEAAPGQPVPVQPAPVAPPSGRTDAELAAVLPPEVPATGADGVAPVPGLIDGGENEAAPLPPGAETAPAGGAVPVAPPSGLPGAGLAAVLPPEVPATGADGVAPVPGLIDGGENDAAPLPPGAETAPAGGAVPVAPVGPGPVMVTSGAWLSAVPEAGAVPRVPQAGAAPLAPTPLATLAVPQAEGGPARRETVPGVRLAVAAPDLSAPGIPEIAPKRPSQDMARPDDSAATPRGPVQGTGASALPLAEEAPQPSDPAAGIVTDRLPRVGDPEPSPEEAAADTGDGANAAPDALTRNGVAFDNPEGRPMVAVVLLDDGGDPVRLPFAVSVAIDGAAPDAAARAAAYRAAGLEVLVAPQIPQGARAVDVSVALEDVFVRIPDAVALIDTPEGALQDSREISAQVLSELSRTGHGLLVFPRGLNTVVQLAGREGVTAALVFRDIDGAGQDLRGIKRFLDQAAFRARQEDSVILVGRNTPETIAALAEWALGNRAASVALVPVSAAMKAAAP